MMEEKAMNYDLPQELRKAPNWVCTREEHIGEEVVLAAYDPTIGESVDESDPANLMTFEKALDLKENAPEFANAGMGFVLRKEDPYISIEIQNAVTSDGKLSEVAKETIDTLEGEFYGEITGSSLIMIVKAPLIGNQQFKNIKVQYFDRDYNVPLKGQATWKPNTPWVESKRFDEIRQYHFKMNCQVDENSKQLPGHYVKTNFGLKLLPNVLVSTLLKRKDWLICGKTPFTRDKGLGIFKQADEHEIDNEIIDHLSPKYLRNRDIEETKGILLKRMPKDDGIFDFSRIKGKINFKNGVYDVKSMTFGPYSKDYHTAVQLDANYDVNAQCPKFIEYIETSLKEDDAKTVQEMMGCLLTTETKAEKAFFLVGPGNTGKSLLIEIVEKIIGDDYVSNVPFQDLGKKNRTIQLFGKLLNAHADLPQDAIKETGIFKTLVSGDRTHDDEKYEKGLNFRNTARLLFATNKMPANYVDQTSGFYRKLILIPFQNVVHNANIDRDLKEELPNERDGIVQWALIGLKRLTKNNYHFTESEEAKNLMKEYKRANNSTLWYLDEYCQLDPSSTVSGKTLYDSYKKACLDARLPAVSQREFNSQIESQFGSQGVAKRQGSQTRAVEFSGIKLINKN